MDYKSLKKIVSSLASGRPGAEAAALAIGGRQPDEQAVTVLSASTEPPTSADRFNVDSELQNDQALALLSASGRDEDRGPDFQAHKTAFFFKLERELEKVRRLLYAAGKIVETETVPFTHQDQLVLPAERG